MLDRIIGVPFIRYENGTCTKITWYKTKDGEKYATKESYNPDMFEMQRMIASGNMETTVRNSN
jgi:hypothetical protein